MKSLVTLAAVPVLFFVFPVSKSLGAGTLTMEQFIDGIRTAAVDEYILRVDFDAFAWTAATIEYLMDGVGEIRWGYNFLGVLFFFVPRMLWTTKPVHTGHIVADGLGYHYTNVSSPLPAEALMGFGIVGPILVLSLTGYAVARIERAASVPSRVSAPSTIFFLYAILMGFVTIILRGPLNGSVAHFGSAFLVLAAITFARHYRIVWRNIS